VRDGADSRTSYCIAERLLRTIFASSSLLLLAGRVADGFAEGLALYLEPPFDPAGHFHPRIRTDSHPRIRTDSHARLRQRPGASPTRI